MPRVAIVTPAFIDTPDKDNWLAEAIRSVQEQQFADWEMIIVDDASPIPVPPSGDPRVRLVRASRTQGPAMCRNTAVGLARAEAILPLDADDKLAAADVLGAMYDQWSRDPGSVVYGDMQYLQDGRLDKVVRFPEYDFAKVLDPKGIIPVTAMHSRQCWEEAGGWKPELDAGLEDVEYWIAAGAAGFCGIHIDVVTLVYRRYSDSRTRRMRAGRQEGAMRNLIREMHADLYEGRYPVGCCGGGKSKPIAPVSRPVANVASPRSLSGAHAPAVQTTVWVRYNGRRTGQFGVRGQATGVVYKVEGPGSEFEIYTVDASIFRRSGRGHDFSVGIAPPAKAPEPEPEPEPKAEFQAPPPRMAQILELDEVARGERGGITRSAPAPGAEHAATPMPAAVQPPPPLVPSAPGRYAAPVEVRARHLPTPEELDEVDAETTISIAQELREEHPLEALGLGRFQELLEAEGWTITSLANANPVDLIPYPGIGQATAEKIVAAARDHAAG